MPWRGRQRGIRLRPGALLVYLAVAGILLAPHPAEPFQSFMDVFVAKYGTAGTRLGSNACAVCHINPAGGGARNDYGAAFRAQPNFATDTSAALDAINLADSDNDGQNNLTEIQNLYFPGIASDRPVVDVSTTTGAKSGPPGTTVTYSVTVTAGSETAAPAGTTLRTYDIVRTGNQWTTTPASASVTITTSNPGTIDFVVTIPPNAPLGSSDTATVTASLRNVSAVSDALLLTTTAKNPLPALDPITPLSPASTFAGRAGFVLTVNGSGFVNTSTVVWMGAITRTLTPSATSPVQLTVPIDNDLLSTAGTAQVRVSNPTGGGGGGLSAPATFTITPRPLPVLSSILPFSALAGSGGVTLTAMGSGFVLGSGTPGSVVRWNGVDQATTFVTNTQLTATIPATLLSTPVTAQVTVFTPGPGGGLSGVRSFDVTAELTGSGARWSVKNTGGTSNGQPTNGTCNQTPGLTIDDARVGNLTHAFDNGLTLWVNDAIFVKPAQVSIVGQTYTTSFVQMGGLAVSVQYAAASTRPILRTLASFFNGGTSPITAVIKWVTNLGSDAATGIRGTSSGDTAFTTADRWVVTSDNPAMPTRPVVTHVLSGPGQPRVQPLSVSPTVFTCPAGTGAEGILAEYVITVPPNTNRSLLFFNELNQTLQDALATALTFDTTPPLDGELLVDLLTSNKLADVVNWDFGIVPAPFITNLAPDFIEFGSSPVPTLTVFGGGFTPASQVYFDNVLQPTTFVSSRILTSPLPLDPADPNKFGPHDVLVINPGGGVTFATLFLDFTPSPGVVTQISPTAAQTGDPGITLAVVGTGFLPGATVYWNFSPRETVLVNPNRLTATIPASDLATGGPAVVSVQRVVSSNALTFMITNPFPIVTGIAPTSTTAGAPPPVLRVFGSGFTAESVVMWNGNAGRPTTFVSSGELRATLLPSDVANGTVAGILVFTPGPGGGLGGTGLLTVNNPAPAPTMLTPNSATVGGAQAIVTVTGSGFVPTSIVRRNGVNRPTTYVGPSQLRVALPAADLATVGTSQLTVFNATPAGGTSAGLPFTVNNPVPGATLLAPSSSIVGAVPFMVTVTGSGFVQSSVVRWNGANRTTTYVGPTQLEATLLATDLLTAATAQITVVNPTPGGGPSNGLTFTVFNPGPALGSVSPNRARLHGPGFMLTVTGTDFVASSVVRWKGAARPTTFTSATTLRATIPASDLAIPGPVTIAVFTPGPGGGTSNPVTFTVTGPVLFDFDGDGKADIGVYRQSTGVWLVMRSSDGALAQDPWGSPPLADRPVPADYDGDGLADLAVYRGSTGVWLVRRSTDLTLMQSPWGSPALDDVPVPGNYDGDGVTDLAVYRRSTGEWLIRRSTDLTLMQIGWGSPPSDDVPVPGDYDGDGLTDLAVYRRSTGEWLIRRSGDLGLTQQPWGSPALGDIPARP